MYLIDALEQQEWKETIIAYALLVANGPSTEEALDRLAESVLEKMKSRRTRGVDGVDVGVEDESPPIDFECDDALEKVRVTGGERRVRHT